MKHEWVNTFVGIVGLSLALLATWNQYNLAEDRLSISVEGREKSESLVSIEVPGIPNLDTGEHSPLVGPIYWRVRVYNDNDRPLSLSGIEATLISVEGVKIYYPHMIAEIREGTINGPSVVFPKNLPERNATAFIVGLNIPFKESRKGDDSCILEGLSARKFEECFYKFGRDLFGNKVRYLVAPDDNGSSLVQWVGEIEQPSLVFTFATADGSRFPVVFPYFSKKLLNL